MNREKEVSLGRNQPRLVVGYGKEKAERKEKAMIARFDHRPLLTALLALSTAVLVVVVITLATLLITAPSTAPPPSGSVGGNAGAVGWAPEANTTERGGTTTDTTCLYRNPPGRATARTPPLIATRMW